MTDRPLQLSAFGGKERAVGPIVQSVFTGLNADLIAAIAPLYLSGSVLDTTYGRGNWWTRYTPPPFRAPRHRARRRRLHQPPAPRPIVRHRVL